MNANVESKLMWTPDWF